MGRIVVSENVTLDGVIQDPTGHEGFRFGGWSDRISAADREAWAKVEFDEAMAAEALLFGRRSYDWFGSRWISRTGEWADRLRTLPKYVVSSGLEELGWSNSTVLSGDLVAEVSTLRQQLAGDIVVYASGQLVDALLEHNLVDELRLMTYPIALGTGKRLFGQTVEPKPLHLVDTRAVGDSLAFLTYRPVRDA